MTFPNICGLAFILCPRNLKKIERVPGLEADTGNARAPSYSLSLHFPRGLGQEPR